jgi:murein DD-endopeptidase MepM/ murein hydrolase activator NlpD
MATALDLGNVGLTGVTSGPHAHWTVTKGGQLFPLSKARKDLGQYIEFRPPGEQSWRRLYSDEKSGFKFNPTGFQGLTISSPMGTRQTGIPGATTNHRGEDYTFPEGTSLRFLGPGSVATYSGQGSGGNVSSLRTGPYELETMHLGRLPGSATTRKSDTTATTIVQPRR